MVYVANFSSILSSRGNLEARLAGELLDDTLLSGKYMSFGLGGGEARGSTGQELMALRALFFDKGKIMESSSFFGKGAGARRRIDERKIQDFLNRAEADLVKVPKAYRNRFVRDTVDLGLRVISAVSLHEDSETHKESFQVHLPAAFIRPHADQINLMEPVVSAALGLIREHAVPSDLSEETVTELDLGESASEGVLEPADVLKRGLLDKASALVNQDYSAGEISYFLRSDYRPWDILLQSTSMKGAQMGLHRLPEGNEEKKVMIIKCQPVKPNESPEFVVLVKDIKGSQSILVFKAEHFGYMKIDEMVTGPREANIDDLKFMNSTLARIFLRQRR